MTTRVLCAVLLLSLLVSAGFAAEKPVASPQAGQTQPKVVQESAEDDPLGRSTPQGAVLGFMRASQRQDYELAVEYLNTKQPAKRAEQLALELQFVMDRGLTDDLNRLSRSPEGDLADGLPPNRERVGIIGSGQEAIDIQLERVQRPNEPPLWLFSGDTLARIPRAYEGLDAPVLDRYLPSVLSRTRILHVSLWRWIAFFVVLPLLFVLARLAAWAVVPLFRPLIRRLAHEDDEAPAERIKNPLTVFLLGLALYAYAPLSHSALSRLFWNRMAATVTVIGVSWLCLRFIDILVERAARAYHMTEASGRIAIARLAGQLCKGIAVVVAAAVILYYAGINLTAVLTGLGVGGVAIAFAAQKTLENLFGGVMIASDQPIRVGDYCRAGEYSGTVENIGLRSTRIRTLDRTVVSVPNGQLSVMSLENFALRDKIRFHHTLSLQCEASADQLRHVLDGIREVLDSRPEVERGSSQVRLVALRNSAFDVEVFAYILATPWDAFLALQEEMLLQMIDVVEASGACFTSNRLTLPVQALADSRRGRADDKGARRPREKDASQLPLPGT